MMQYCKGYLLATKLGDRAAANLVVDSLIEFSSDRHHIFCDKQVNWIIETLPDHSGLYKLTVDMWAFAAKYDSFKDRLDFGYLPHRFMKDIWLAKLKAEAEGKGKPVEEAFSYGFIKDSKKRYHGFSKLDLTDRSGTKIRGTRETCTRTILRTRCALTRMETKALSQTPLSAMARVKVRLQEPRRLGTRREATSRAAIPAIAKRCEQGF